MYQNEENLSQFFLVSESIFKTVRKSSYYTKLFTNKLE